MVRNHIIDDDEGKTVVNAAGQEIGLVTEVRSGTAYVDADPGLADTIRSKLGWSKSDEDDFTLEESSIDSITDDEIRLLENL